MNAPSEDIKDILTEESSLGLIFARNLFIGREPTTPRNCVTIFDTYGATQDLSLVTQGYERPTIQIRVRNTSYKNGYSMINEIKSLLHGFSGEINGTLYTVIYCSSGPALLDWDENGNVRFIINFNVQRR